ncbi:ADP compounds hydrolase NudE OS=Rhodanobacter lindaniclasticus OX=75310 GN=B1991_01480 PE=4 SV=1 [Rhodanobacter lindaniclasticus]
MRKLPIIHATRDVTDSHFLHVEQLDLEFSNGVRRTYERLKGSSRRAR